MGYRSQGKIYLSDKAQELLPEELQKDLNINWDKAEEYENIWEFDYWKWYSSFDDVKKWETFINKLSNLSENEEEDIDEYDWDITIVGEDGAIYNEIPQTYTMFSTYTIIEINQ